MNKLQQFSDEHGFIFSEREKFEKISSNFNGVIILLPTWSPKDFTVIEHFANKLLHNKKSIFLFDIDEFKTHEEIESLFPNCPFFHQTPVIIEYQQGEIKYIKSGPDLTM